MATRVVAVLGGVTVPVTSTTPRALGPGRRERHLSRTDFSVKPSLISGIFLSPDIGGEQDQRIAVVQGDVGVVDEALAVPTEAARRPGAIAHDHLAFERRQTQGGGLQGLADGRGPHLDLSRSGAKAR